MRSSVLSAIALLCMFAPVDAAAKRVGILVFDGVLTSDVTGPAEALGMAIKLSKRTDWTVEFISAHDKPSVTTHEGLRLLVDHRLPKAPDVDVLIVAGSYINDQILALPGVSDYLKRQTGRAERIASNCAGAFMVASTGAYDGRTVTTYATGAQALKAAYPKVNAVEGTVVVDKEILTSNGGVVSYEAAIVLVAQLFDRATAQQVFEALQMGQLMQWARIERSLAASGVKAAGTAPAPTSQPATP